MNSIVSIIMTLVITISNLFGLLPVTDFFEELFSFGIVEKGPEYGEELPKEPSNEKEEITELENSNVNASVPEEAPETVSTVKLVPAEGSTTVIDENTKTITGLKQFISELEFREDFVAVDGDGYYETEYPSSGVKGFTGTGTKIKLYDNTNSEEPVAVYTIVIYGDVNGDSTVTATDGTNIDEELKGITSWSQQQSEEYNFYKIMAADLNKDGVVNADDSVIIGDSAAGIRTIDQVSGISFRN